MSVRASLVAYDRLGVEPVVNACGVYTEYGGSCLSESVWEAAAEVNAHWASMSELLDRSGERICQLIGVEAARVVPGAAAGITLSVAACIARGDGRRMEQLPDITGMADGVVMQRAHRYRYDRCARIAGGRIVEVEGEPGLRDVLGAGVACVLHPAHLEGANGSLPLGEVAAFAHDAGIPVVVDAAFMVYPTELIGSYADGDLVCVSAKYYSGPNAGGFVYGRRDLVDALAAVDFTGFEMGDFHIFGRPFKLERTAIAGTVFALEEWLELDHDARWAGYAERVGRLAELLDGTRGVVTAPGCFTLEETLEDEPVNALIVRAAEGALDADRLVGELAAGRPSIRCVPMGDALVFCVETVRNDELEVIAERLREVLRA